MSNPVTKLPNGDNQVDQNANRVTGNAGGNRAINVSADQGREIFGQVSVNLSLNVHSHPHAKERADTNGDEPEVERQNRQTVNQGRNSTPKAEATGGGSGRTNDLPDQQQQQEPTRNNPRIAIPTSEYQSAKLMENSPVQPLASENQNSELPTAEQSAKLRYNTNRAYRNAPNQLPPRQLNLTINNHSTVSNYLANAPSVNSNSIDVLLNNLTGEVVRQVFRENDVYLSNRAVDTLIERYNAPNSSRQNNPALDSLSKEIFRLVETIENQLNRTPLSPRFSQQHAANQVNIEIPQSLDEQIRAAANLLIKIFGADQAQRFSHLDIRQRMLAAVEIFFRDSSAAMPENLRNYSVKEVLDGFLLARGLVDSGSRYLTESLLGMMRTAATDKVSLTAMRDFGRLVKVLILDAAAAKSNANLETAVGKFARILIAVNRLDAALTAVKLANQSQLAGGNVGRTVAIAQVDELINRLVTTGERAMKEAAAQISEKNAPHKSARGIFPPFTIANLPETDAANKNASEPKTIQAESSLRQFLEFNPLFAHDKSLSAFENSDFARQARNDFLSHHQIEIEEWLRGGNHRLVKDIDFEKPLGIVVERGASEFLSATTARIVLVRDGSAQGWHFLKSFLIA